jgi:hypothetical protein
MSPTELAARTYIALWEERDPAKRAEMIDACFAADGHVVTGGEPIRGRAGLAKAVDEFLADPRGLRPEITSAVDVQGPKFRFASVLVDRDGNALGEFFDAAEVVDGRITVLIAFRGALPPKR